MNFQTSPNTAWKEVHPQGMITQWSKEICPYPPPQCGYFETITKVSQTVYEIHACMWTAHFILHGNYVLEKNVEPVVQESDKFLNITIKQYLLIFEEGVHSIPWILK